MTQVRPWSPAVRVPSTVVHVVAILTTVFRLLYRWHLSRFWWEDGWAVAALICDVVCLASVWISQPPHHLHVRLRSNVIAGWLLALAVNSVVWLARMSILCSAVRIANPTPKLRRIAYATGILFLAMEAGLIAQRIDTCIVRLCYVSISVAIAQLVTDLVADVILVALPIWFLRDINLPQDSRILVLSAFSASILISCVTILHSVLLFQDASNATLVIGHVKAALALFVCNSLILATFVYRLYRKAFLDGGDGAAATRTGAAGGGDKAVHSNTAEFTTIIDLPSKFSTSHTHTHTHHHHQPTLDTVSDDVAVVSYTETCVQRT